MLPVLSSSSPSTETSNMKMQLCLRVFVSNQCSRPLAEQIFEGPKQLRDIENAIVHPY